MISNGDGINEVRYDTKENWELYNPILEQGELAIETEGEVRNLKCGDGKKDWENLEYVIDNSNLEKVLEKYDQPDKYNYIKYSSGKLECWGAINVPANTNYVTVTLPVSYRDISYTVETNPIHSIDNQWCGQSTHSKLSENQFTIKSRANGSDNLVNYVTTVAWKTIGWWK